VLALSSVLEVRKKKERQEREKNQKKTSVDVEKKLLRNKDRIIPEVESTQADVKLRKIATKGGKKCKGKGKEKKRKLNMLLTFFVFVFCEVIQLFNAIGAQQKSTAGKRKKDYESSDEDDTKISKRNFLDLLKRKKQELDDVDSDDLFED
jgi:hypothetical protein